MKFWAASGKTDNCKTNLPNFHSQLHCKATADTAKTAKLRGVRLSAHVGIGSTTFSSSQGSLAAWGAGKQRMDALDAASTPQCCRTFFSQPITWAWSHLCKQTTQAFTNDAAHDAWRRLPEASSHHSAAHLTLPMKKNTPGRWLVWPARLLCCNIRSK